MSDCTACGMDLGLERKCADLQQEIERLRTVYSQARGLCFGVDWNNGTHANHYRNSLIDAVDAVEALPRPLNYKKGEG